MDPLSLAIAAALIGGVPTLLGWLTNRAVKQVDGSVASLIKQVEALSAQDTKILVELAELRVRVTQLEFTVNGARR